MKIKNWTKGILLIVASLGLAACHSLLWHPHQIDCPPTLKKGQTFNRIVISNGNAPITIRNTPVDKMGVKIIGNHKNVSSKVVNGTLYLSSNTLSNKAKPCPILINSHGLRSLTVKGNGPVTLPHFHSAPFELIHKGSGKVTIQGKRLRLTHLVSDGPGATHITGISTPTLTVLTDTSNTGSVTLTGKIGLTQLDALGIGTINITGITPKPLSIRANNVAPINLSGRINLRTLHNTGNGDINIDKIVSNHLDIEDGGDANLNLLGDDIGLSSLIFTGSGTVNIFNVNSPGLCIRTSGKGGVINIAGQAKLNSLVATGRTDINLLWLFSDKLKLWLDTMSHVKLAGTVDEVNAMIRGDSVLDAKYLRAKNGYITTFNKANASVWLQKRLFAKAYDNSNIYYFSQSPFVAKYSSLSGSVLPLQY